MMYEDIYKTDPYAYVVFNNAMGIHGACLNIGVKVIPTEWAIQNGVCKKGDKGVIVGHGKKGNIIRVRKNTNKTASIYWGGFWRDKNWKL